jgi:uncharacterized membrane protein YgdD (TMEM256/DUF423 family)
MKYTIALLGITAVVLGAFGAHGLKDLLEHTAIQSYKTAVSYHLIHTVAILALYNSTGNVTTIRLWIAGILMFSGSIYALTLDELGVFYWLQDGALWRSKQIHLWINLEYR